MASKAKPSSICYRVLDRRVASLLAKTVIGWENTANIRAGFLCPLSLAELSSYLAMTAGPVHNPAKCQEEAP
jgi:hypothetical protein